MTPPVSPQFEATMNVLAAAMMAPKKTISRLIYPQIIKCIKEGEDFKSDDAIGKVIDKIRRFGQEVFEHPGFPLTIPQSKNEECIALSKEFKESLSVVDWTEKLKKYQEKYFEAYKKKYDLEGEFPDIFKSLENYYTAHEYEKTKDKEFSIVDFRRVTSCWDQNLILRFSSLNDDTMMYLFYAVNKYRESTDLGNKPLPLFFTMTLMFSVARQHLFKKDENDRKPHISCYEYRHFCSLVTNKEYL